MVRALRRTQSFTGKVICKKISLYKYKNLYAFILYINIKYIYTYIPKSGDSRAWKSLSTTKIFKNIFVGF